MNLKSHKVSILVLRLRLPIISTHLFCTYKLPSDSLFYSVHVCEQHIKTIKKFLCVVLNIFILSAKVILYIYNY